MSVITLQCVTEIIIRHADRLGYTGNSSLAVFPVFSRLYDSKHSLISSLLVFLSRLLFGSASEALLECLYAWYFSKTATFGFMCNFLFKYACT